MIDIYDEQNQISSWLYSLTKETPAKMWWHLEPYHPAIARALMVDRSEIGGVYALSPFRLAKIEETHLILAAYPAPRLLDDPQCEWLDIDQVIAWNPQDNSVFIMGDAQAQLVGKFREDRSTLFGDPHAFFVAWAQNRAAHFQRWLDSRRRAWVHEATEMDEVPGCLVVGDLEDIRWSHRSMPRNLPCVGLDVKQVNRAIMKSACLPYAQSANNPLGMLA